MGEAKRKQQRQADIENGAPIEVPDLITGKPVKGRRAPTIDALLGQFANMAARIDRGERGVAARVPCADCTACCRSGDRLHVGDDEDASALSLMPPDDTGQRYLKQNPDGSCVHLGPSGCTVHPHRPWICRTYDCRLSGVFGVMPTEASPDHPFPVWVATIDKPIDEALTGIAQSICFEEIRKANEAGEEWSVATLLPRLLERYLKMRPAFLQINALVDRLPEAERRKMLTDPDRADPYVRLRQLAAEAERSARMKHD